VLKLEALVFVVDGCDGAERDAPSRGIAILRPDDIGA